MIEAVVADPTQEKMYYSRNESEPLIDMIFRVDGGFDAIQSTIAKTHNAEADKIRSLKKALALTKDETLRIFYVLPKCRYDQFETNPVNPLLQHPDLSNVFIYHVGVSSSVNE
jgi:hypothetical protein